MDYYPPAHTDVRTHPIKCFFSTYSSHARKFLQVIVFWSWKLGIAQATHEYLSLPVGSEYFL